MEREKHQIRKPLLAAYFIYLFTSVVTTVLPLSALLGMEPVDTWAEVKKVWWTVMEKHRCTKACLTQSINCINMFLNLAKFGNSCRSKRRAWAEAVREPSGPEQLLGKRSG